MSQSRPNFFELLNIDPSQNWSDEEFQATLKAKRIDWTKKSNDPRPQVKLKAKQHLDMIPLIQQVMEDATLRNAEASELDPSGSNNPPPTDSLTIAKEKPKMSNGSPIFGIDLGTTYSCIAYVDQYGRPSVVQNMENEHTTPSVVQFSGDERIVGKEAKQSSMLEPDNTISMVKRQIGKGTFAFEYDGKNISAEEVSAYILKKLVKDAEQNTGLKITDVVITCPAYFGIPEREATKKAGEIAGLNVRSIINEPTAAAIAYGVNEESDQTILVYDLGGGTFDITMIQIERGNITVICTDGDHELGGRNWDEIIVTYLAGQWQEQTGSSDDPLDSPETQQELYVKAEQAKQTLTAKDKTEISVMHEMQRARVTLTREIFDGQTANLLENTITKTKAVIAEAKKRGIEGFDQLLMVGGSTKMPQVARRLKEEFNIEPKFSDPDESVAKGAAIYGQKLMLDQEIVIKIADDLGVKPEDVKIDEVKQEVIEKAQEKVAQDSGMQLGAVKKATNTKIINVASQSFGLKVYVNQTEQKIKNLILKNDRVPASVTQSFGTFEPNQTSVELVIFENSSGDDKCAIDISREISNAEISDLPSGLSEGSPIEVTFKLNEQGILDIYARELSSNRDATVTIQTEGGISQQEFEEARERSKGLVIS
jgi:molecular chaperone DnaK